jgi:hypothetical protein
MDWVALRNHLIEHGWNGQQFNGSQCGEYQEFVKVWDELGDRFSAKGLT